MQSNPIQGKTFRFSFDDGPMAGKTIEHKFLADGGVLFGAPGKDAEKMTRVMGYEVAPVNADVCAVSYLGTQGYTLTTILDFKTGRLVGFASNDKQLTLQHGSFEDAKHRA